MKTPIIIPALLIFGLHFGQGHNRLQLKFTDFEKTVHILESDIDKEYANVSSTTEEFHYVYKIKIGKDKGVRLKTEVLDQHANPEYPLRITVRFNKGTNSWQVPFKLDNVKYMEAERTLCLHDGSDEKQEEIAVVVSTSSLNKIQYRLILYEVQDYRTKINQNKVVKNLGVASPVFHYVDLSNSMEKNLVTIQVRSNDNVCGLVSVQPASCPIADGSDTIRKSGSSWQTMLGLANFNVDIRHDNFFISKEKGFFIVFIALPSDQECGNQTLPTSSRSKTLTYTITNDISTKRIALEAVLTALVMAFICIGTFIIAYCYENFNSKKNAKINPVTGEDEAMTVDQVDGPRVQRVARQLPKYVHELAVKFDHDRLSSITAKAKAIFQKSDLYIWLVLMMGIFYGIPAIQLVLKYQDMLEISGNNDMCYYNFLCTLPLLNVRDFNHVFSNIGYMFCGLTYIAVVWYRKKKYVAKLEALREAAQANPGSRLMPRGLPQHFGIYYAMGFALISEGVLSAIYHVCPTNENFQFDTTFMYVIAVLSFIKIYQFRHPDISSSAYKVFFAIGLIMFLEVIGIFFENTVFWIISLSAYSIGILLLSSVIYKAGEWSLNHVLIFNIIRSWLDHTRKCDWFEQASRKRLFLVAFMDLANLAFIVIGVLYRPNISTYLLLIFIGNLVIYTSYYIAMKLYHKESIPWTSTAFAIIGMVCWGLAMKYFVDSGKSTNVSAAESRNVNQECIWLDLYDTHDVWHFFSAFGLFLSFMMLLTLDDGLHGIPRDKIHVF